MADDTDKKTDDTPKFDPQDLAERADEFFPNEGIFAHVVAGALHGIERPLTVEDARKKITAWLNKPVAEDTAQEAL